MPAKFKIGDRVVIKRHDDRTPKELLEKLRLDHHRRVTSIFYDEKTQHNRYYLGTNKRGIVNLTVVPFRASQLKLWVRSDIGRTCTIKRRKSNRSKSLGVLSVNGG